jgi:hypothetical protein
MSSETVFGDGLLSQFSNVQVAFEDRVVAKPDRSVFHRIAATADPDQPKPACRAGTNDTDWHAADPDTVRRSGLEPCQSCYERILEFLAQQPDSPVELRTDSPTSTADIDSDAAAFEPVIDPTPPQLAAITTEVLVQGSNTQVMHAPTDDGPLCDQSGDFRRVDRDKVDSHYRPCRECFSAVSD